MMLVSWLLLWIMLAALQTYLDGQLNIARAIGRGIDHRHRRRRWIRRRPVPALPRLAAAETFPVFTHFIAWSMAYLPGLYVLLKR